MVQWLSTVTSQQEDCGFDSHPEHFCGFFPGSPASSNSAMLTSNANFTGIEVNIYFTDVCVVGISFTWELTELVSRWLAQRKGLIKVKPLVVSEQAF